MWASILTVSAFAIAMAHVETMIVVYLRRLYYPDVLPRLPNHGALLREWVPSAYRWWMLALGQGLAIVPFLAWVQRAYRNS